LNAARLILPFDPPLLADNGIWTALVMKGVSIASFSNTMRPLFPGLDFGFDLSFPRKRESSTD
jgi:hypothetical protein